MPYRLLEPILVIEPGRKVENALNWRDHFLFLVEREKGFGQQHRGLRLVITMILRVKEIEQSLNALRQPIRFAFHQINATETQQGRVERQLHIELLT